ncbi:MAG: fibronectin type III domain-containing protein, partial [Deltaproteobacteria bacterium]|nr:fibronectin type III domain-containing protein [Deltaproteobacteria bacterium]
MRLVSPARLAAIFVPFLLAACGGSSSGSVVTVSKTGSGTGTVASSPSGIDCGGTCAFTFTSATVTLTASPASGSRFDGWGGACTGVTNTCTLTLSGNATVTANFVKQSGSPGAPGNVSAEAGDGEATVRWTAPSDTGGSPLTGFIVTSSPGNLSVSAGASATSAVVSGLTNGTSYTFSVVAENVIASSDPAVTAPVTPKGAPGKVMGVTLTPGDGQVTVSWTAPNDN